MNCQFNLVSSALLLSLAGNTVWADKPALPEITTGWKFQTGDAPIRSQATFDDTGWRTIKIGSPWEAQGVADYDGYAWYRLRLPLTGSLRATPNFQASQALKLTLGKIDDVDETWFNGNRIGGTGRFPDVYSPAWQTLRVYLIPAALIRWDQDNVIAVRVYDGNSEGGMVQGPYSLEVATANDFLEVNFDGGRGDGILSGESGVQIGATIHNANSDPAIGKLEWTIEDDEGTTISTEADRFDIPAKGTLDIKCDFAQAKPGFYKAICTLRLDKCQSVKSASMVFGYQPESIQTPLTREPDLDEFWAKTKDALAKVSPDFQITRKPEFDSETHIVYEAEMRSLDGVRVRGWYERPKMAGTYPALLRVPGYAESMRPTGSGDPIAFLSFNIRAHGNSQDDVSGKPVDYWIRGLDDKQGYFYQGAYADCLRAVDFLCSRPEVDKARIAVTGGSQGGGLSWATAALDDRIALCAPDIPFLCDWVKYFKTTEWSEMDQWIEDESHRSWETTLQTLAYFDTLNLADRIKCPVLLGVGLQDDVCPPATIFSVYNRLRGPKEYHVYPDVGHWVDAPHNELRRRWILKHFTKPEE